jgi:hypothetical protein
VLQVLSRTHRCSFCILRHLTSLQTFIVFLWCESDQHLKPVWLLSIQPPVEYVRPLCDPVSDGAAAPLHLEGKSFGPALLLLFRHQLVQPKLHELSSA